jgi:hypothetical protein
MKSRKRGLILAGLAAILMVLGFAVTAGAGPYVIWSGTISGNITVTNLTNGKLKNTPQAINGTCEMYSDATGFIHPNGYYLVIFDASSGLPVVGIRDLDVIRTKVPSSKSETIQGVGTGDYLVNGVQIGYAYCTVAGKILLDAPISANGNPTKISGTLTLGGGYPGQGYFWSFKHKGTLTPK